MYEILTSLGLRGVGGMWPIITASTGFLLHVGGAPAPWQAARRRLEACMGVSDRMATDGVLYEGWGAKGMHNLNRTVTLQEAAESLEVSRYDAVLMVSARAKENAYRDSEERPGGYIGNSFGGPRGGGAAAPAG